MPILKRVCGFFLDVFVAFYAIIVASMPIGGFLFLAAMIGAALTVALASFGVGQAFVPIALLVLGYGWKIYLGVAVFVVVVMTTGTYQHCCVGLNTFMEHLKHAKEEHYENLVAAVGWPVALYFVDRWLRGWCMSWALFALGALEYWFVTTWKGTRLETLNVQTGETTEEYIKSKPKE